MTWVVKLVVKLLTAAAYLAAGVTLAWLVLEWSGWDHDESMMRAHQLADWSRAIYLAVLLGLITWWLRFRRSV